MATAESNQIDDRRQFFRIKNWLFLSYEIDENPLQSIANKSIEPQTSPRIQLLNELRNLEEDNVKFMGSIEPELTHVSQHIANMNKKIGLLTQYIIQSLDIEYNELLEVDLSAGGIRFHSTTSLRPTQQVKMEIVIIPEYYGVVTHAKVVDCTKLEDGTYDIAFKFVKISAPDRDKIMRHIFKEQSKQLRNKKGFQSKSEIKN